MADNTNRKYNPNRRYKREVKTLMLEKGIKYTRALREIKAKYEGENDDR